jgi:hypothetical protein
VFCVFVSKYLMAFPVSTINALKKCFGFLSIAYSNLTLKAFICRRPSFVLLLLSCVECMFHCFCVTVNVMFVSL